jgi:methylglutaconyl-CoA hydratase
MQQADMAQNLADSEQLATLFKAMRDFPGVLFGAINGHALAGGCGLVTMCDIALTHDKAKFGYTETRIGFVPAIVAKFLIEKVGSSQANRLLLGAEIVSAEVALGIGLVHEVATVDNYKERLAWWTDHLAHGLSAEALASTKKLIRLVSGMDTDTALQYATRMNAAARMSADCKKGIAAFLDKETIRWS